MDSGKLLSVQPLIASDMYGLPLSQLEQILSLDVCMLMPEQSIDSFSMGFRHTQNKDQNGTKHRPTALYQQAFG